MCLDDELTDTDSLRFLPELRQDFYQAVIDTHRQVSRKACPKANTLYLGIFFPFRTFQIRLSLPACHLVNGIKDTFQRLVLTHKSISTRYENIAQLRVILEISHQTVQFLWPCLLRLQVFQIKIKTPALKIIHALAGGTQAATSSSHGIGNKNGHYRITAMDIPTNFSIVASAADAQEGKLNIVNCIEEEVKVELTKPTPEGGRAALLALERALAEYREGYFDVLVTAPINKSTIQSDDFHFPGHTEYIEQRVGNGQKALMILLKDDFRVALVTGHIPVSEISKDITKELIKEKLAIFHRSLKQDFNIDSPRIAVFSLNPHAGDEGLLGTEEQTVITPAIQEMAEEGVLCFGPYPADGFMGSGNHTHFDGILAMYHDQGLAPFKALAMDEGVNFTAGLPIVRTSPAHGTAYDIAGQGIASEDSFRQAVYVAIDVFRHRCIEREISAHPLRKQYYEKRDDSDKLKLDTIDED